MRCFLKGEDRGGRRRRRGGPGSITVVSMVSMRAAMEGSETEADPGIVGGL